MKFGEVIEGLKEGKNFKRCDDNWLDKVITMQIPADIPSDIIPNMQSLNDGMKALLGAVGDKQIHYRNQVLIIDVCYNTSNYATYYVPTWEDIFAEDWVEVI